MPRDLTDYTPDELYDFLDRLTRHRQQHGRGHNEGAVYVREYCKEMRRKIKDELKRRELPATRPTDCRVYGPGQAAWQKASAEVVA